MTNREYWVHQAQQAVRWARDLLARVPFSRLRPFWLALHRGLALSVGVLFVVMGLTGSLNVFHNEFDRWLNPRLTVSESGARYRSADELLAAVQAAHPRRFGSWTLVMPERPDGVVTVWFEKPAETYDEFYAPLMVSVNPYTAEVVASRFWGDTVMTWILKLHEELFMGRFGRTVVGCVAALLLVSLATGLTLWWPGRGRVRQSLRITLPPAHSSRLLFEIHRAAGVYGALILFMVALSGLHLVFPEWLESAFRSSSAMGDIHDRLDVKSEAIPNSDPVSLGAALLIARGLFPKSPVQRLITPDTSTGSHQIWFGTPGQASAAGTAAIVCVDQFSGHILHVERVTPRPAGDAFLNFIRALHTGQVLGTPGRLLWSLAGWVPLVLYVTGIRRRRLRRASQRL
ncbi:PepSY-associated TM helix domain-containing protein [Methylotetracoccus oryzae]|uniref:PepSY-associated TM helix domain-containing protein n=1 Tax=Methylotetracoccus oryzae TaxID=1919059 RepID=UPI0013A549C2|nr:PepSY-associated TM helix domain-containing protein [Methylotetracoccus oryzae]